MRALLARISMPDEAAERTLCAVTGLSEAEERAFAVRLTQRDGYDGAYRALLARLPADGGFAMLKIMLRAALLSRELYRKEGVGEDVFFDTMGCFSRFVREHKRSYGVYGFDRGFWTGRQLSLSLFRFGTLEFETNGAIHIPSDADLSPATVAKSIALARASQRIKGRLCCSSWLLSPSLGKLLPDAKNINRFRNLFHLERFDADDESYKLWVFGRAELCVAQFSEDTSLQRAIKKFVSEGGKIGSGFGYLAEEAQPPSFECVE